MILLIGPGGAGKTTTGAALADRLGVPFVDLDAEFAASRGDISTYLDRHGYDAYAEQNVSLYSALTTVAEPFRVVALSSGFMTYRRDVHPSYPSVRDKVASSPSTFVLLPSLDLETCVVETVRRQLTRSFTRPPEREQHVIRTRFPIYATLPARKVETMRPVAVVIDELLAVIRGSFVGSLLPDGVIRRLPTVARWRPCTRRSLAQPGLHRTRRRYTECSRRIAASPTRQCKCLSR